MSNLQIAQDIYWGDVLKAVIIDPANGKYEVVKNMEDESGAEQALLAARDIDEYITMMIEANLIHPGDSSAYLAALREVSERDHRGSGRMSYTIRYRINGSFEWTVIETIADHDEDRNVRRYLSVLRRKMLSFSDQGGILDLISVFHKVLKVDLARDTYQTVRMPVDEIETMPKGNRLSDWFISFAKANNIHPNDVDIFKNFTDITRLRRSFAESLTPLRCRYRRRIGDDWHWVMMELIPTFGFSAKSPTLMLYIKDIDDDTHGADSQALPDKAAFNTDMRKQYSHRGPAKTDGVGVVYAKLMLVDYITSARGKTAARRLVEDFGKKLMSEFRYGTVYKTDDIDFAVILPFVTLSAFNRAVGGFDRSIKRTAPPLAAIGSSWTSYADISEQLTVKAIAELNKDIDEFGVMYPQLMTSRHRY